MQALTKALPNPSTRSPGEARRTLGLWDTVSVIVGIVIGAGVYETAPLVLANAGTPVNALLAWVIGGVLSLVGACCYAELASAYPSSGGDYVYLGKAYGRFVGYLFGWAQLTILMTGSIGMLAYVFADHAVAGFGLSSRLISPLAAAAVVALTLLNVLSFSIGKRTQNLLNAVKLIGILAVVAVGLLLGPRAAPLNAVERSPSGSLPLAMILVLYTFGGWNDAAFVASEVRERHRNLPRALLLGTLIITLTYLLMNASFIHGLGFDRARSSETVAVDLLKHALGAPAGTTISLLIMISALGAVNALIFTGSRVCASLGKDYGALSALGIWHARLGTPIHALLWQAGVTLLLISAFGTNVGRTSLDWLLVSAGMSVVSWTGHGGFDTLLRCTAPLFWAFFALSALSTIVLRIRDPKRHRPFSVPLYPLLPTIFVFTCLFMLTSAIEYAGSLTLIGLLPVVLGTPLYLLSAHKPSNASTGPGEAQPALKNGRSIGP